MKHLITAVLITGMAAAGLVQTVHAAAFLEKNGVVVVEVESRPTVGKWVKHVSGSSRYAWTKFASNGICYQFTGNSETSGPVADPIYYQIKIVNPGTYECYLRGLEAPIESGAGDQANDCYIKMAGQSDCEGVFTKMVLLGSSYQWSWEVKLECGHHNFRVPTYSLAAGVHTFAIAGRSKNFFVDRFHIIKKGAVSNPKDLNLPVSPLEDGTTPDPGPSPSNPVAITKPASGTALSMGSTVTLEGTGDNLSWAYDANSDGKAEIAIGTGSSVSFKVPTGIKAPMELTLICRGDGGTDQEIYNLTAATPVGDNGASGLSANGISAAVMGTELAVTAPAGVTISVLSADGQTIAVPGSGITRLGTSSYRFDGSTPGMYFWSIAGKNGANLLKKFIVIK